MNYKTALLSSIIFGFISLSLNSQVTNTITKPSLTKYSLAEKIYIQIDNTLYQTGETIWFKVVVSKSFDNSLSDLSGIIYVELIDFNEDIVETKTLKLNQGISSGSFDLQGSFKTGKYALRAYTHWNRNFEDDFIFSQPIDVFNLKQKEELNNPIVNALVTTGDTSVLTADINPKAIDVKYRGKLKLYIKTDFATDSVELSKDENNIYKLNYQLPERTKQAEISFKIESVLKRFGIKTEEVYSKTVIIDEDFLDIQFFPEGGNLVSGLLSTVGLKSLDYKGLGHKVSGRIKDNDGTVVTTFSSNDLGMCSFKLLPELGKNYYAEIYKQNVAYTYALPKAKGTGSVLSVTTLNKQIILSLMHSSDNLTNVRVKTASRGITYHDFNIQLKHKQGLASIPKGSLPDGIVKISVYNPSNQIINERLYFNTREDRRLNLSIRTAKENYIQREKTSLKLKLDSLHLAPKTSVSVLVLQKEKLEASKQFKPSLLSFMLLNSELKGFIEHPSSYFDATNAKRALDLDALMLTQGWRTYKYDKSPASTYYRYKAEKNLTISGTIGEYFNPSKRPKKPLDLNMIVYAEPADIYKQEIDSSGRYRFEIEDINKPNAEVFMQVVNKKGEPIDFNINLDKKWQPEISIKQEETVELPSRIVSSFTERVEAENKIQRDYEVAYNTVALDEVKLRDYKLTPAREKFIALHGEPDVVIDGKKLNENKPDWSHGVLSVLQAQYTDEIDVLYSETMPPFLYAWATRYDFTYVLVDNIPVIWYNYNLIGSIPVEEVESIDIIKDPRDKRRYCTDVFIDPLFPCPQRVVLVNIYTKSGKGLFGIAKAEGVRTDEITGFSESIEFYSPNYETLSNQDWVIPDNRSVIHWSPDIQLDKSGEHTLEFYNDDYIGEVSVIVETISKDGKIGYVEKTYTINEAER